MLNMTYVTMYLHKTLSDLWILQKIICHNSVTVYENITQKNKLIKKEDFQAGIR